MNFEEYSLQSDAIFITPNEFTANALSFSNNADVEDSILMDGVTVDLSSSATIRKSIIGPNAKVSVGKDPKNVIRLILGRDSSVEL